MRLIKLVYIAHGWHSALRGERLIDENPEAWKYGPVIPSLYHEFKDFGNSPITRLAMDYDSSTRKLVPYKEPEDSNAKLLTEAVWKAYRQYTAIQLSAMTHRQGTPWYRTWHEEGGCNVQGMDIPHQYIVDHYEKTSKGEGNSETP